MVDYYCSESSLEKLQLRYRVALSVVNSKIEFLIVHNYSYGCRILIE